MKAGTANIAQACRLDESEPTASEECHRCAVNDLLLWVSVRRIATERNSGAISLAGALHGANASDPSDLRNTHAMRFTNVSE